MRPSDVGKKGGELEGPDIERDADLAQLLLQHRGQQARGLLGRGLHREVKANAVVSRDIRLRRAVCARVRIVRVLATSAS